MHHWQNPHGIGVGGCRPTCSCEARPSADSAATMSLQGVTLVHASAEFAAEHTHKRRHCEDPTRAWRDINGSGVVVSARDAHALITRSHAFTLAGECECGVAGCTCTQGPDAPRTALPFRVNRTRLQHRELMVVPANEPGTRRSFCCEGFSNFALSASGQARCRKRPSDSTVLGVIERQCFCGALVIREKTTVALLATGRHVLTILKLGSQRGALCSEATPAQRMTITARWRVKVAANVAMMNGRTRRHALVVGTSTPANCGWHRHPSLHDDVLFVTTVKRRHANIEPCCSEAQKK